LTIDFRVSEGEIFRDPTLVRRAGQLPVANVGNVMNYIQAMRGGFRAYGGRRGVVGDAFTVGVRAVDNLMLHRAIDLAQPGDIVVCDGGGDLFVAVAGDLMIGHVTRRGHAALVTDGAVRDIATLAGLDIGVWACGVTPVGTYKEGWGEVGYPVSCGGQVVMPGDLGRR
jgi:regulator of RNase E activity RraA